MIWGKVPPKAMVISALKLTNLKCGQIGVPKGNCRASVMIRQGHWETVMLNDGGSTHGFGRSGSCPMLSSPDGQIFALWAGVPIIIQ